MNFKLNYLIMKTILLISLSIFIISLMNGQDLKRWEIGLEGGFNLSKMTGQLGETDRGISSENNAKNKWIGSPAVGFLAAYNFTPLIALTGGLYMMKSGVRYVYNEGEEYEYSRRERFTTLRIPIMARFMWGTTWQYYGLIGFYVSKRLCGKYVDKYQGNEQSGKIKFEKDPDYSNSGDDWIFDTKDWRRLNAGLQIGAGIRRALGPGFISFNATFGYGFCDFRKWDNKDDRPNGYKAFRDMNIAFLFGYAILLGNAL